MGLGSIEKAAAIEANSLRIGADAPGDDVPGVPLAL